MELIESFIAAKTGEPNDCEDNYIVNEHFAAVIDGASNVSDKLLNGKTPGKTASLLIKEAVNQLKGTEDITDIVETINHQYIEMYKRLGISGNFNDEPYVRPSAAMIIYSNHHRKIWMIGDCQCYFNEKLHQNIKRIDEVFEEARSIILRAELINGKTPREIRDHDIGYELIKPLIQKQYHFQNYIPECSLSYGVVNGLPIPTSLIKAIPVPNETSLISFGSDGYPLIYDSLVETENALKRLIELDPLCINENMGVKAVLSGNDSFDDRTYIKIAI